MTSHAASRDQAPALPPTAHENDNSAARRARVLFFWALGVGAALWLVPAGLTFVPSAEVQTLGVLIAWVGFLPVIALAILAIVFGALGLSRARQLNGKRRGSALVGLIGGIAILLIPIVVSTIGTFVLLGISTNNVLIGR